MKNTLSRTVPGIQIVVSIEIKIETVEIIPPPIRNPPPPFPPKIICRGFAPKAKSYEGRGCEKKSCKLKKSQHPVSHFSNGPSLSSVFWFANAFSKSSRFPPIKLHTTWGLIVNSVAELCCFSCKNSSFHLWKKWPG